MVAIIAAIVKKTVITIPTIAVIVFIMATIIFLLLFEGIMARVKVFLDL